MTEIEDKTGLIKRFMQLQPHVEKITDAAEQIKQLNFAGMRTASSKSLPA